VDAFCNFAGLGVFARNGSRQMAISRKRKTRKDAWQFWDTLKALKCRPPSIGQQIEVQSDAIQKIVLDLTPDQEYIYEPDIGS